MVLLEVKLPYDTVCRLVGRFVTVSQKGGKFHAPIGGALVSVYFAEIHANPFEHPKQF